MKIHELKTWPDEFQAVKRGEKNCEVRVDDRSYGVGDRLLLREWAPRDSVSGDYTGDKLEVVVTHITRGWGLPPDLCVMSIRRV